MCTLAHYPVFPARICVGISLAVCHFRLYHLELLKRGKCFVVVLVYAHTDSGAFGGTYRAVGIIPVSYTHLDNTLWQISHKQILEDVINKVQENKDKAKVFLTLMEKTYNGEEPSDFINEIRALNFASGETPEALIKVYKWIWGQEDVNYPTGEGRLMSWKEYQEIIAKL